MFHSNTSSSRVKRKMLDITSYLLPVLDHLGCLFCCWVLIQLLNQEEKKVWEYPSRDYKNVDDIFRCSHISLFSGLGLLCFSGSVSWWHSKSIFFFITYKMSIFLFGLSCALMSLGCFLLPLVDNGIRRSILLLLLVMIGCCVTGVAGCGLIMYCFRL